MISRRLDGRSESLREELKLVPIVLCGAETIRRLVLRVSRLLNERLLLEGGRFETAEKSLMEIERLEGGGAPSP